jgi:hypothetical protein
VGGGHEEKGWKLIDFIFQKAGIFFVMLEIIVGHFTHIW